MTEAESEIHNNRDTRIMVGKLYISRQWILGNTRYWPNVFNRSDADALMPMICLKTHLPGRHSGRQIGLFLHPTLGLVELYKNDVDDYCDVKNES